MRKSITVRSVWGVCEDCHIFFDNCKNAQALAAKHAKKYKHRVYGQIILGFDYNGRKEETQVKNTSK